MWIEVQDPLQFLSVLVRGRGPVPGDEHLALTFDVDDVHAGHVVGREDEVVVGLAEPDLQHIAKVALLQREPPRGR